MAVTEVVMGLGSWSVNLAAAPRELTDRLQYFGHVAVISGRVEPRQYGDELLTMARYVGVLTRRESDEDRLAIGGQSMNVWLGDSDDKGEILEEPVVIEGETFANSIRALLGDSTAVAEGTLHSVPGTYTGRHQWESRRKAVAYVCDTFGAEYRVNGNATLDAGTPAQLYRSTPTCVIVRKGAEGRDLSLTGLPGEMQLTQDVEDFTTRVVLLAEGEGESIATGSADISSNPYRDLRGQPVKRVRLVSESGTATTNAEARAQLQLNRFVGTRNALRLSTAEYIVDGSLNVGDPVYVYDPDAGLYDTGNEITIRGQRINPIVLRAFEVSWPVTEGMTVAYRTADGVWHDLTDYVLWEDGSTTIGVGALGRRLTSSGFEPVGSRPMVDTTIPGVVQWVLPFQTAAYVDAEGITRAALLVAWELPLNSDGSTILDGHHYEIQYGVSPADTWQTEYAPWGALQAIINDLSPGVEYDVRIRAVDTSGHTGDWSDVETALVGEDTIPPSTPAPPTVAGSPLALQIRHELGKASGGTFNLELDLDHLDIHVGDDENFTPDETTLVGSTPANAGMMQAQVPAIATVQIPDDGLRYVRVAAVDRAGNASDPSEAVPATALLLDSAHITDLTVTKVSAGTISSNWLLGANIGTASSGQRVELNATGLHGYNSGGTELVTLSNTGSFTLRSAASGPRVEVNDSGVHVYDSDGTELVGLYQTGVFFMRSATTGARVDISNITGLQLFNSAGNQTVQLDIDGTFSLKSATTGARVELDSAGIRGYNSSGSQTFHVNASNGNVDVVGRFTSTVNSSAARLVINPLLNGDPEIRFYEDSTNYHYITSFVETENSLQIGTVPLSGRKFVIDCESTNSNFIGLVTSSDTTTISGMRALTDGRVNFIGSGVASNGGALRFQVQSAPGDGMFRCFWNGSNIQFVREDTNTVVKTFVINHPADPDRYLVHATTESPHNGVEYWGTARLDGYGQAVVQLPDYFEALTAVEGRAVLLTAEDIADPVAATYPRDGRFVIRGPEGRRVHWLVKAIRKDVPPLTVEPRRGDVVIRGDGPYRYLVEV